ncbi:hypothetical protein CC2G_010157 [Coprinopsis cinerea AmutBmut pab1-1]|nr:hypothetical protein CC2G_010157 [Coprinopsis cinerea AmutBmut pab1-1]
MQLTHVLPAVVFATYASAAAAPRVLNQLFARQIPEIDFTDLGSSVPASCRSDCSAAVRALNGCQEMTGNDALSCICSTRVFDSLLQCYPCIIEETTALSDDYAEAAMEGFTEGLAEGCVEMGFPVPGYEVPGGSPARPVDDDDEDFFDDEDETPAPPPTRTRAPAGETTPTRVSRPPPVDDDDDSDRPQDILTGAGVKGTFNLGVAAVAAAGALFLF